LLARHRERARGRLRDLIGTQLNQYRITATLGAGGMGEVFRARDTRLNRDVAVKVLPKDFARDADRLRRFEQEAKTLAALNHPNVVTIHDAGVHEGAPYLVSELLEGQTVREALSASGAAAGPPVTDRPSKGLSHHKTADYALQIAQGLAAAHAKGIVHRDLKPENLFLTRDGRIKILDFGLAKLREAPASHTAPAPSGTDPYAATVLHSASEPTGPGKVMGTPNYMAPEQVRGEVVDHRADIFAFGCVLYELVSGQRPFKRDTAIGTMAAIMNEEAPDLAEGLPTLSPTLNRIVRRCLEKLPERRFHSAADLAFALETLQGSSASAMALPAPPRRGLSVPLKVLLGGAALVLAGVAGVFFERTRRPVTVAPAPSWRGERLDGPTVVFGPRLSPDGKELSFTTLVNSLNQLAVMNVDSGDWKVLTTNRTLGLIGDTAWSPDGSQILFAHHAGGPNGVYRISKYGGEERLVVEAASDPKPLANGSILVTRRRDDRNIQLFLYSPETEKLLPVNGILGNGPVKIISVLPGQDVAVFLGRTTNRLDDTRSPDSLLRIDLKSGAVQPFLTNVFARLPSRREFPFGFAPDGSRFLFAHGAESLHRIFAVDPREPRSLQMLFTLPALPTTLATDREGNVYLDQIERPREILRRTGTGPSERIALPSPSSEWVERGVLPLPSNRFLFTSPRRGKNRLILLEPGKEPRPFLESKSESGAPFARLGSNQVVFTVWDDARFSLATASLEGRGLAPLRGVSWTGARDLAVAGAPDGKTVYYALGDSVYAMAVSGGSPTRLCAGQAVAADPHGQYLVVLVYDRAAGNRLIRYSLSDRTERPIPVPEGLALPFNALSGHAVGPDGRILLMVTPLDNWFWPAAILDPLTGKAELATEHDADMPEPGWDSEGRVVSCALFCRSSLWRFRPDQGVSPHY
jgi:serine/threonine protein kinase